MVRTTCRRSTVQEANERYRSDLHVDLPVTFALEGLALSEAYWERFRTLRGAVVKASNRIEGARYTLALASQRSCGNLFGL